MQKSLRDESGVRSTPNQVFRARFWNIEKVKKPEKNFTTEIQESWIRIIALRKESDKS